jgi:uncharacterized protein
VSAALKPGSVPRTVFVLSTARPASLYVTRRFSPSTARYWLVRLVRPAKRVAVAKDPGDDKFLECADAARADYLVTGNLKHFPRFWKKTKIITSREFLTMVGPHLVR